MSQVAPPVTDTTAARSLRDRRRDQTLQVIHNAAVDLVNRNGLAATTVDQIATASGVSARTVFNYYATKEDAVLGLIAPSAPIEAVGWFHEHAAEPRLLERTISLLAVMLQSMNIPNQDITARGPLLEAFPELLAALHLRVTEASELLEQTLAELEPVQLSPAERHALRSAATAVVQEAFIVIQHARFPTPTDLDAALSLHRAALLR